MNLVKYEYPGFTGLDYWLEDAFKNFGTPLSRFLNHYDSIKTNAKPSVDFYYDDENYYAKFSVPGIDKKEINLEIDNGLLTLYFEKKEKDGDTESSHSASRSVAIPDNVDNSKVKANLKDGFLTITLPKIKDSKPKNITIK